MEKDKQVPELEDIREMILKYSEVHKDACFVFSFMGFKDDPDHKCIDCGGDCEMPDETKTHLGAYGDINRVRGLLNELRDVVEDDTEEYFVNV